MDDYTAQDDDEDDDDDLPRHRYYASEKLLGHLYRAIDEKKIWTESIKLRPSGPHDGDGNDFWWRKLLRDFGRRAQALGATQWHPQHHQQQQRLDEARRICHAYEEAISSVMADWSDNPSRPLTELEVFVGFIVNRNGGGGGGAGQSQRQRDRSVKLRDEFDRIPGWVTHQMRHPVVAAAAAAAAEETGGPGPGPDGEGNGDGNGDGRELHALELCMACVQVGCEKTTVSAAPAPRAWSRADYVEVQSFKIVAAAALMRELNAAENKTRMRSGRGGGGGGFVGVRGGQS
ncbi:hypothetical protein VTK56DRAFT_3459 [Thermocarpiscus australiensis]